MKATHRRLLNMCVDTLKGLHFNPENIMVTGSIALDAVGILPENRFAHDFDFVIKMDDQTWRCMKLIEAINRADLGESVDERYPDRKDVIFLSVNGFIMNIWKYDGGDWSEIKDAETGIYIATADNTIKAKKRYARSKDYQDINEIVKTILL